MKKFILFICFSFLLSCASTNTNIKPVVTKQPNPAVAITTATSQKINWQNHTDSIYVQAEVFKKVVLIYFSSDTCKPCVTFEETMLKDNNISKKINKNFVPVLIKHYGNDENFDFEQFEKYIKLYNVKSIPTVIALLPDKKVIWNLSAFTSFLTKENFSELLKLAVIVNGLSNSNLKISSK